jgi:uncharacterized protein with FMN-binding domain
VRRIVSTFAATVTAVVLLFSYSTSTNSGSPQAATSVTSSSVAGSGSSSGSAGSSGSSSDSSGSLDSSGSSASGSSASSDSTGGTFTGDAVDTRWGPVQVQITVQDGKVTAADVVQVPDGNHRDQEINAYAVPVLNQEVLDAQSAGIDSVSGATVTSDGYVQSLQSALDAAHLS